MHLHHPALSYNGKKKGKVKFASSEAKQKSQQLEQEWKELQKRWGVEAEEKKRTRGLSAPSLGSSYTLNIPKGRNTTDHIKSVTGSGSATLSEPKIYTGTKVKGIATMHKSNAVPVFSDEEAVDISKMRR
jgi:hypothetical protein